MPPLWRSRFNFLLSLAADVTLATGIVPARNLVLLRAGVLCVVFQQWVAATVSGFILPRAVPLTLVYVLYHRWLTFTEEKVAAFRQAKEAVERAAKASSGSFSPSETSTQSTTQTGCRKGTYREVSGYDVSNASGEEVVELSSWTDTSSSRTETGSDIRRRMMGPK